jgi:ankyrin repeat protein
MKRAIFAAIIFLLLGAATSIALAWAAVLWEFPITDQCQSRENGWVAAIDFRTVSVGIAAFNNESRPAGRFEYDYPEHRLPTDVPWWSRMNHPPSTAEASVHEIAAGWPLPCLRVTIEYPDPLWIRRLDGTLYGGIDGASPLADLAGNWADCEFLPIQPIWPDLMVNAILLGAAWLVITLIPSVWRLNRAIRRRLGGRCEACGYSLAGLTADACPECGRKKDDRSPFISGVCLWSGGMIALALIVAELTFAATFIALRPYEPIHRAAYQGDAATVEAELQRGVDVDAPLDLKATYVGTPLWLAARGKPEVVSMLIDAGADVQVQGINGERPLHVAAEFGRVDVIALLLEAGAEVDAPDARGAAALSHAVFAQEPEAVRTLIEAGADVNVANDSGTRALDLACVQGDWQIFEMLIDAGARVPAPGASSADLVAMAMRRGRVELVDRLLELGATITDEAMFAAARHRRLDLLTLLAERGGNLHARNMWGETLLFALSPVEEERPLWEFLIEEGVDINALNDQGETVLAYWAHGVGAKWLEFILEMGADPTVRNAEGETAFDHAGNNEAREVLWRAMQEGKAGDDER